MGKILAGKISDIPIGKMLMINSKGKKFLVANIDGNYFAMDDSCTHQKASLSAGTLKNSTVTCPWHGATWDCKTGKMIDFVSKLRNLHTYKVTIESDNVVVNI